MTQKKVRFKKSFIIFSGTLAAALIMGAALFWFLREGAAPRPGAMPPQSDYRMQAEGLRFYGTNQGRRVISIAADRFTLRKGKIGFFSTGLTQRALIENGVIEIYAGKVGTAPTFSQNHPRGLRSGSPPLARNPAGEDHRELATLFADLAGKGSGETAPVEPVDFSGLFSEETFASLLPARNISEIEVAPVTVRLHGERGVLTQIAASGAFVRLREREIVFAGNVRVSASGAELKTERLSFFPETALLETDRPFVLKQGRRTLEGTGFKTNIFLK
jgi:hypothetical protein